MLIEHRTSLVTQKQQTTICNLMLQLKVSLSNNSSTTQLGRFRIPCILDGFVFLIPIDIRSKPLSLPPLFPCSL